MWFALPQPLSLFAQLFLIWAIFLRILPGRRGASLSQRAAALVSYVQLPLSFEENLGQTDPAVKFLAGGVGYTAFLPSSDSLRASFMIRTLNNHNDAATYIMFNSFE